MTRFVAHVAIYCLIFLMDR